MSESTSQKDLLNWSVEAKALLDGLKAVSGVIESSQVMQILSFVRIEGRGDHIRLTTSDAEVQMQVDVPLVQGPEGTFSTAVSCRKLLDICRSLDLKAAVAFEQHTDWLTIRSGSSHFKLATLDAETFPMAQVSQLDVDMTVSAKHLASLLGHVQFAMAQHDVRYFLNGLHWVADAGRITVTATDGHRMAVGYADWGDVPPMRATLPRKCVQECLRTLHSMDPASEVQMSLGSRHVVFQAGRLRMTSNLLEGEYPDCQALMPHPKSCLSLSCCKETFQSQLKRAAILAHEKFRGVRMRFESGRLHMEAHNADHEKTQDMMPLNYQGDTFEMGFNIVYLHDVLQVIEEETLNLYVKQDHKALLMTSEDDALKVKWSFLVMPLTL